jgi:hypothetical protein
MQSTPIDKLYDENAQLSNYLLKQGEISFYSNVQFKFQRELIIACASYFETTLIESLEGFFRHHSKTEVVLYFVQRKAINRQYHTYFQWDAKNANAFFSLFGDDFKNYIQQEVKRDKDFDEAIKAFLELGNSRNHLVHGNFATFTLNKTSDEIYDLYKKSRIFVENFRAKLDEFCSQMIEKNPG